MKHAGVPRQSVVIFVALNVQLLPSLLLPRIAFIAFAPLRHAREFRHIIQPSSHISMPLAPGVRPGAYEVLGLIVPKG